MFESRRDKELRGKLSKSQYKKACKEMGRKPLNPIGQCFETVAHDVLNNEFFPEEITICHAVIEANMPGQEGQEAGHAWIEFELHSSVAAADTTWGVMTQADHYRSQLKTRNIIEYNKQEFLGLWKSHDFPGPFDHKIKTITDRYSNG